MRNGKLYLEEIVVSLFFTFCLCSNHSLITGDASSIIWKILYYGKYILILFLVILQLIKNDRISNRLYNNRLSRILLIGIFLCLICSLVGWFYYHVPFPYISRGISTAIDKIISCLGGIVVCLLLKDKVIRCISSSIILMFLICFSIGIIKDGEHLLYIFSFFGSENNFLIQRYLEMHETIFIAGLLLTYLLFARIYLKRKFCISDILILIIFLLGNKRIGFLSLIIASIFLLFMKRRKISSRRYIINIATASLFFIIMGYVMITINGTLVSLLRNYGINMMGRNIIYSYFTKFSDFNVSYLGRGMGFVDRQFSYTTSKELYQMASIKALHNDYLKLYIEYGFIGLILWIAYWLIFIKKIVCKDKKNYSMIAYFSLIIYSFITYSTDNTEGYFNFHLVLITLIYTIYIAKWNNGERKV